MPNQLTDIAERLLAACYHNPEQVGAITGEDPVMPDAATDKLWGEMEDLSGPQGFDPARLSSRLGMSGIRAGLEMEKAQAMREVLEDIFDII